MCGSDGVGGKKKQINLGLVQSLQLRDWELRMWLWHICGKGAIERWCFALPQ
ncbi:hypothetical protein BGZ63DRAFT_370856 [Mariannaea sp. PMI_226]|nr:hypothetical protein BGZ63DRAFT_370856 [Mariannaea sp. PMI_226]